MARSTGLSKSSRLRTERVVVRSSSADRLSFIAQVSQRRPRNVAPQQFHLDVMVDDVENAAPKVVALGAQRLVGDVFADPAGHPFCLVTRPAWADPIGG